MFVKFERSMLMDELAEFEVNEHKAQNAKWVKIKKIDSFLVVRELVINNHRVLLCSRQSFPHLILTENQEYLILSEAKIDGKRINGPNTCAMTLGLDIE
jgi:hypothetical protein